MKSESMKDALKMRRARGLDVSIIIGGAEPMQGTDEEQKKMGLAPDGAEYEEGEEGHEDEAMDKMLIQKEIQKLGLGKNSIASKAMRATNKGE
jgi:hypothetical protein